ncbi:hypothetical protein M2116_000745 [Aurantimicrobium minutum]|uniref:hypothetical protein n=1 Tax=Aurantimicrobium minutum TaxID=708131 RepID=UPI0024049D1A|nr:hypothetical protein [Aurantimicrobium minutum]MDF9809795.1 hypothetical protein [Aurantimicrobium minutum]
MKLSRARSAAVLVAASSLLLVGCASTTATEPTATTSTCDGVHVVVNYGILDGTGSSQCVEISGDSAKAIDVVHEAGFETEGTATYGDAIVCRVNGLPSPTEPVVVEGQAEFTESCADMPPAYAYWALWQKSSDIASWDYAQAGLGDLTVKKGESLGLVFTTGDSTPTPVVE